MGEDGSVRLATKARAAPSSSSLRRSCEIAAPRRGDAVDRDATVVSVGEAESLLGTSRATLYRWLAGGFIVGEQDSPGAPWRIRIDQALRDKIAPQAPADWVDLAGAAAALGVSRQTVLDRIRRGELKALHVNRGQRRGLAIELPPRESDLFSSTR